jgi:hypothetical protein
VPAGADDHVRPTQGQAARGSPHRADRRCRKARGSKLGHAAKGGAPSLRQADGYLLASSYARREGVRERRP